MISVAYLAQETAPIFFSIKAVLHNSFLLENKSLKPSTAAEKH